MRLIDADALEEGKFHGTEDLTPIECALWQWGWNDAIDAIIDNAPTVDAVPLEDYKSMGRTVYKLTKALADAVEVVRCKDCKYCLVDMLVDGNVPYYVCIEMDCGVEVNGFCSWGERRKDEDE